MNRVSLGMLPPIVAPTTRDVNHAPASGEREDLGFGSTDRINQCRPVVSVERQ